MGSKLCVGVGELRLVKGGQSQHAGKEVFCHGKRAEVATSPLFASYWPGLLGSVVDWMLVSPQNSHVELLTLTCDCIWRWDL